MDKSIVKFKDKALVVGAFLFVALMGALCLAGTILEALETKP